MKKRVVLVIALMLGLISSLTVYQLLNKKDNIEDYVEKTKVVVASKKLEPKERITVDAITLKEVPLDVAHYEAATSIDQVVGYFAKDLILEGEQILLPRLIKGFEDYGIVIKIPPDRRAMTVPVDNVIGVGGFIRPGDYVDVIAGFDEMEMGENVAKVIMERILVLATDQEMAEDQREPQSVETITLAVTLDEAAKLALSMDHGVVRLALRPIQSTELETTKDIEVKDLLNTGSQIANNSTKAKPALSQLTTTPKPKTETKPATTTKKPTSTQIVVTAQPVEPQKLEDTEDKSDYQVEIIRGTERSVITVVDSKEGI